MPLRSVLPGGRQPISAANLCFTTLQLTEIRQNSRPLQILFAGKAHPRDQGGQDLNSPVFKVGRRLGEGVRVAYLKLY